MCFFAVAQAIFIITIMGDIYTYTYEKCGEIHEIF